MYCIVLGFNMSAWLNVIGSLDVAAPLAEYHCAVLPCGTLNLRCVGHSLIGVFRTVHRDVVKF